MNRPTGTCQLERCIEGLDECCGLLSCHGINHQEDVRWSGRRFHFTELIHQFFIDLSSRSPIHSQNRTR